MSDHSLTPGDPRETVHFRLEQAVLQRFGINDRPAPGTFGDSWLAFSAEADDPEARRLYAVRVNSAWGLLAFACVIGIVAVATPVKVYLDETAGLALLALFLGLMSFCLAGCAYVLWRSYTFVPNARRLKSRGETDTEEYAIAMRRTLPRNGSLVFQAAVAIVVVVFTLRSF